MIRTDRWQAAQFFQGEMLAVEHVIQRLAYEPPIGMEGVEHAAADARVEQAAELSEQPHGR